MLLKPLDPCSTCLGYSWSTAEYVPASGSGENGVLVVAEAGGEHEAKEGMPLVGKVGHDLWQQLLRVGVEREGFRCHNVLSCRPPNNKLAKMPYELTVINHCAPLLDATIEDMRGRCLQTGKTFVILALGQIAFKRILGLSPKDPILREDYLCYPFWSQKYQAWVLAADHPGYLVRGNNHLWPVLQFTFKRALEIAETGLTLDTPQYLLDPDPPTFSQWVNDYLDALRADSSVILSYDIETPMKQGQGEDTLSNEDDDYTILRISFSYQRNIAVSVPWRAEYLPMIEQLFAAHGDKLGWNSRQYDDPRILQHMPINGNRLDGMLCWHVLNSALDKSLGSVTPYYVHTTGLWKHLSDSMPAFYNAKDSDMCLRNFLGIRADLQRNGQWDSVIKNHIIRLNQALDYMSGKGVLRDEEMRKDAEDRLTLLLDTTESAMEATVPVEARRVKVYKKAPVDTAGMIQVERVMPVKRCSICHLEKPKKAHFKPATKKQVKLSLENVCQDAEVIVKDEMVKLWAQPLQFKLSKVGLSQYQKVLRHQAIISRREGKVTFDEGAIIKLMKHYPNDPLYPLILKHRELQKLLTTYIGLTQYAKVFVPDDYILVEGEKENPSS